MSNIKAVIAKINKKFGENTIGHANDLKFTDVSRVTSGSLFLDWALGKSGKEQVSGFPLGRVVELFGPPSSGKSLLSMKTIAAAQKKGINCAYIDCENSFDKEFATKLGVDVDKLLLSRESIGEKVIEIMARLLESKEFGIIVLDSVASMIPLAELEADMENQQMAMAARMMSKALRKLTTLNEETLLIFINQLRLNPGTKYGNPEYTPGGKSLGFYASIRVAIRRGDWIVDTESEGKPKIGQMIKFKVEKNKTAPPLKDGYFKLLYTGEIDEVDELISLAILGDDLNRKEAWFYSD